MGFVGGTKVGEGRTRLGVTRVNGMPMSQGAACGLCGRGVFVRSLVVVDGGTGEARSPPFSGGAKVVSPWWAGACL